MRLASLTVIGPFSDHHPDGLQPTIEVWFTEGFIDRLFGIFATSGDHPLLLVNCRRVHGFGLRRSLFLTFLDRYGEVLNDGVVLRPRMTASDARAAHVLESWVPLCLSIGDRLAWRSAQAGAGK